MIIYSMRRICQIVVHYSYSPDDLDIGFEEIDRWHRDRGFLSPSGISCGYHFIVRRDGRIEVGRPENEIGAHCRGHNRFTLGVVWVGRTSPTPKQYKAMLRLLAGLKHKWGVQIEGVVGHEELVPGAICPNIDMNKVRAELLFPIL
jgi:N-acetylmuramoyl-L-alanine amidase